MIFYENIRWFLRNFMTIFMKFYEILRNFMTLIVSQKKSRETCKIDNYHAEWPQRRTSLIYPLPISVSGLMVPSRRILNPVAQ